MNRRSQIRNALGLVLGLAFVPWTMAQDAPAGDELPSAESILDRYVEVTGGAAVYESRTSEAISGTFEIVAAGLVGQLQLLIEPGMQRTSIELPGVGLLESGVKDGLAWENTAITGPRILEGSEAELAILSARPGAAARWREQYSTVETAGRGDVNGEPVYRVVQTLSTGDSLTSSFSVDSGLLVKNELTLPTPLGDIPVEQFFEEYSDFDGILSPSRLVMLNAGQRIVMTFTSGEANVDIPDERFDLPEPVQAILAE
jgi:hypothetical protein